MATGIAVLRPKEAIRLDPARLAELEGELGPAEVGVVVSRAVGELALLMAGMARDYRAGELHDFARNLRSLRRMADHVGMVALAQVAATVAKCLAADDATALAATWARLLRVGESSLAADWDKHGLSG